MAKVSDVTIRDVTLNIISGFWRGLEFWNWGGPVESPASPGAFLLKEGRLPTNPSLRHVLIEGNAVTNSEDEIAEIGGVQPSKPRYRQAVQMDVVRLILRVGRAR